MHRKIFPDVNMVLVIIFFVCFVFAIGASYYKYFYTKNYDYLVESSCNPDTEKCKFRDCESEPDSCPPNNLSYYKEYYVKAYDFPKCKDNSCSLECESGSILCTPVENIN